MRTKIVGGVEVEVLVRIVNGDEVDLTDEEAAEMRAEWAANDPANKPAAVEAISTDALASLLTAKGIITKQDITVAIATEVAALSVSNVEKIGG